MSVYRVQLGSQVRLIVGFVARTSFRPDVEDLASWYGQAIALPTLVTRGGEPVILCQVEMTTNLVRQTLNAALDDILEPKAATPG